MKKLNIGCGRDIKAGWVNLDIYEGKGVDVMHDLNKLPLPFDKDEFDFVLCQDILEHVDYNPLITDIYRILKKGGTLKIRVPHFTSSINYDDPTHINGFSIRTFNYFIKDVGLVSYDRDIIYFSKIKKMIIFDQGNLILKISNSLLQKWVNKSEKRQIYYESSFLRIFPALNIEISLTK